MKIALVFSLCLASLSALAGPRYLGHVTGPDAAFVTIIQLNNQSQAAKTLILDCHSKKGQLLEQVGITLDGGDRQNLSPGRDLPAETRSVVIHGSERVTVGAWYAATLFQDRLGTKPMLQAAKELYNGYELSPAQLGDLNAQWTGLVITAADEAVDVTVELPNTDHQPEIFSLAPHSKQTILVRDLYPPPYSFDTPYQIHASSPFQLNVLGGVLGGLEMWTLQPAPNQRHPQMGFSEAPPEALIDAPMTIRGAQLNDDILSLDVTFPNGCTNDTELFMTGGFMESSPVQVNLLPVRHETQDVFCTEALIDKQLTFDLSPLIVRYREIYPRGDSNTETLLLNILDAEGKVFQQLSLVF